MLRRIYTIFASIIVIGVFSFSADAATYFTGNLNGAQEVPPNASTATGFGRVTLNNAETSITVSVYYGSAAAPLGSNVTIGHIHEGVPGVAGPIIFDLAPTPGVTFGSVVNATFAVTPAQVAVLKAGNYYFNIHTTGFPAGEIRGQINVDSPYVAYMAGGQENPGVSTNATGSGAVSINSAGTQALVTMNWSGLSGNATIGHVHNGRSGVNGGIVCNLNPPTVATGSVVDFLCTFTPTQITSLRQGQFYLNVHTGANPGGEIRGQIQRRTSTVCDYDGDSITDAAIARTANPIQWWIRNSSDGSPVVINFGPQSDYVQSRIVCGDYDGDGRDDIAYWRTGATPNAFFFIVQSSDFTVRMEQFGTTSDDPRVVEDYDGDGRADIAVFRSSNGTWYYKGSSNNAAANISAIQWGTSGSFANPGDFDGDGRGDFLVQIGVNWWLTTNGSFVSSVTPLSTASAFGVPGDYDGDGKTDIGASVSETPNIAWYYISSVNPSQNPISTRRPWGPSAGTRTRAQGDYDGDGKSDYAVWIEGDGGNPPAFWALPSNGATPIFIQWGMFTAGTNDFPTAGYNNR